MRTSAEVERNLHFLNTGPNQIPGLIAMQLDDNGINYGPHHHLLVVFNATSATQTLTAPNLVGLPLELSLVQQQSADPVVRTSTFKPGTGTATVPALTTAVFETN